MRGRTKTWRSDKEIMGTYLAELQARVEGTNEPSLDTGLADLDKHFRGLKRGQLTTVAAKTSHGKTAFALTVAANVAYDQGCKVVFFSLEMVGEELIERLVAQRGKVPLPRLVHGDLDDLMYGRMTAAVAAMQGNLVIDDSSALTVNELRTKLRRIRRMLGNIDLVVVDYLQLMTGKGENRNIEVGSVSRGLKQVAKEMDVPVMALSQVNRSATGRPSLASLRESGSIEQDSNNVLIIYRPDLDEEEGAEENVAVIAIEKQRQGRAKCGVRAAYIAEQTRFVDLAHDSGDWR